MSTGSNKGFIDPATAARIAAGEIEGEGAAKARGKKGRTPLGRTHIDVFGQGLVRVEVGETDATDGKAEDATRVAASEGASAPSDGTSPTPTESTSGAASALASTADASPAASATPASTPLIRVAEDKAALRRKKLAVALVLAALACVSLCITGSDPLVISPVEVVSIYATALANLFNSAFNPSAALSASELIAAHPTYYWTLTSLSFTVMFALNGCLLALAGALYQNVFRNPIAAPNMLGVSSGVQLGIAILVMVAGASAGALFAERYVVSYVAVAVSLGLLFGLSRLMSGKGRPLNVVNMLLVGTIINQFIGVVVTYLTWYVFDDELYDLFVSLTTFVEPVNDVSTWAILAFCFIVCVLPVYLMRFSLNALSFNPADARDFGVNTTALQALALLAGSIVMVAAQLQVGMVAMVTLVVPHISRAVFGAEFRKTFSGTVLIGAAVLVACRILAQLIPYPGTIPLGVVVNLVLLPAFVWMIATQQKKWD